MAIEINAYSRVAHKRAKEKIGRVAAWLYRWGFADRRVIAEVAGDDLRYAARLAKKGLLRRVQKEGHRDGFVLTQKGVALAEDALAGWFGYRDKETEYRYLDGRIPWGVFEHSCMVQQLLIKLDYHFNVDCVFWSTERELAGEKIRPDAELLFFLNDGDDTPTRVWIELERSTKNVRSRKLQMWDRLQAIKQGKCDRIIWVAAGRGVEVALCRAILAPYAVKAWRCEQSRIHLDADVHESMAPLRDASQVVSISEFGWDVVSESF